MEIPCLIVAYARSANVEKLIRDLHSQGVDRYYVAIDGAKSSDVAKIQEELTQKIHFLSGELNVSIKTWHRNRNLGIAVSVITALDWFFSKEEFGIIIEDDLQVSEDFVQFLKENMSSRPSSAIMISGNKFFPNPTDAILSSYPATWGWATWKNEWTSIRGVIVNFPLLKIRKFFSADYQFWFLGALRVFRGKVDTWDIPLALYMKNYSRSSLLPPSNLVSNVGADDFANHTFVDNFPIGIPIGVLDSYKIDCSQKTSKQYDRQLRKSVYQIRFRHVLLAPYILLECLLISFERNRLNQKVRSVSLGN
jgi:GR25 family glycosyltransferase involved in LPS biosynthesis